MCGTRLASAALGGAGLCLPGATKFEVEESKRERPETRDKRLNCDADGHGDGSRGASQGKRAGELIDSYRDDRQRKKEAEDMPAAPFGYPSTRPDGGERAFALDGGGLCSHRPAGRK